MVVKYSRRCCGKWPANGPWNFALNLKRPPSVATTELSVAYGGPWAYAAPATRGMTLIELLVVLALVGLLAAVLVPALQRADHSAGIAQSAANLRVISSMAHAYAAENNGLLPPMTTDADGAAATWDKLLRSYTSGATESTFAARLDRFARPPGKTARSYSLNPALAGKRLALLAAPGRTALLIERHASLYGEPMAYVDGPPYRPTGYSDFPYDGKTQLAFADGSVSMVSRLEWTAWHERYIFP